MQVLYKVRHKNNPEKTYISHERHNLNYSRNIYCQEIVPDILKISFIYSVGNRSYTCLNWKVRFYNWTLVITATAIPKMWIKLIAWNQFESPPNSVDLNPLDYHVCDATPKPTNTYGAEERCVSDLGWLASRSKLMQQYRRSAKGSACKKQPVDISNMLSELMLLASTYHVSLQ